MSKKIPISVPQQPLQTPFSALSSEGLRDGPTNPPRSFLKRKPRIVLRRERSQRGGKTVIVASQFPSHLSPAEIESLSRDARMALGSGGFVQGREIAIQGEQAERVRRHFEGLGYEVTGP